MTTETIKQSESWDRVGILVLLGFAILGAITIVFVRFPVFQHRWLAGCWLLVGAVGMTVACVDYATKDKTEEVFKRIIFRLAISCLALVFSIGWLVR
jgi:hypothetical protein